MSPQASRIHLSLPARAENVAVVRHAVAGFAEALGMDETRVGDLKTVVTEACTNVAVHAYDGDDGPMEVEVDGDSEGVTVQVSDRGEGIRPRAETDRASLRLGLTLIAALSESFEIAGGLGGGTRIRMRVPLGPPEEGSETESESVEEPAVGSPGTEMAIESPELVAPVLSRVISVLAARTGFSVDRLSDAMLLGDALSASIPEGFPAGPTRLAVEDGDGTIDVRVGPMSDGAAQRVRRQLDLPQVGGSLENLADRVAVETGEDGEYLAICVRVASPRPGDANGG
ncbi:MAG: ATP-binding protein [Actinomycetota bacterium]